MEHLTYKNRLRAGAVQPGEEKALRSPEISLSVSKGGEGAIEKKGTDFLAWVVVIGQGEMVSNLKRVDFCWI